MQEETKVILKYCEGCGALGLRPAEGGSVYCAECRLTLERAQRQGAGALKKANGGRA